MKFFLDVSRRIMKCESLVFCVLLGIIHELRIFLPQEVASVLSSGTHLAKRDGKFMI